MSKTRKVFNEVVFILSSGLSHGGESANKNDFIKTGETDRWKFPVFMACGRGRQATTLGEHAKGHASQTQGNSFFLVQGLTDHMHLKAQREPREVLKRPKN